MEVRRCHLCSIPIYPGEKRCLISIHIFPDQEEDLFFEDDCADGACPMEGYFEDLCSCSGEEGQGEAFREAHVVLCKDCQDQFLKSPFIKENLFFLKKEEEIKNFH